MKTWKVCIACDVWQCEGAYYTYYTTMAWNSQRTTRTTSVGFAANAPLMKTMFVGITTVTAYV